ncbi:MAG: hypothetical protein LDL33_14130 [Desulfomonile sp.]|nr:hypothetical protein [Desulfomonile sp.]
MPILLTLNRLYAGGPVFHICTRYDWKFMIVLTDRDLPSVNEEFQALGALQSENRPVMAYWKEARDRLGIPMGRPDPLY